MVPGRQQDQEGPLVLEFSLGCCCGTGSVGANRTCCKRACILLESATGEKDRPLERLWHVRHAVAMQKRTPVGLQATDATSCICNWLLQLVPTCCACSTASSFQGSSSTPSGKPLTPCFEKASTASFKQTPHAPTAEDQSRGPYSQVNCQYKPEVLTAHTPLLT
jgi:hypothetical protein